MFNQNNVNVKNVQHEMCFKCYIYMHIYILNLFCIHTESDCFKLQEESMEDQYRWKKDNTCFVLLRFVWSITSDLLLSGIYWPRCENQSHSAVYTLYVRLLDKGKNATTLVSTLWVMKGWWYWPICCLGSYVVRCSTSLLVYAFYRSLDYGDSVCRSHYIAIHCLISVDGIMKQGFLITLIKMSG